MCSQYATTAAMFASEYSGIDAWIAAPSRQAFETGSRKMPVPGANLLATNARTAASIDG